VRRRLSLLGGLAVLIGALAACGAQSGLGGGAEADSEVRCGARERNRAPLPPFPEPARSPALRERPAGRVVPLSGRPEGLAFDETTGQLAVGLNEPRGLIAFVDGRNGEARREVAVPGGPRHLRFEQPGGPLLVPAEDPGELIRVPPRGAGPRSTPVGASPTTRLRPRGTASSWSTSSTAL